MFFLRLGCIEKWYCIWYYTVMARDDKIIQKMKQSPKNIRFEEVDTFLRRRGFEGKPRGSHVQYRREDGMRFSVVRPHGDNKTVNQNAISEIIERLGL